MSGKFRKRYKRLSIERAKAKRLERPEGKGQRLTPEQWKLHLKMLVMQYLDELDAGRPGLRVGIMSAFDWHDLLMEQIRKRYTKLSPDDIDNSAIASDWEAVGQDLYGVLNDSERRRRLLHSSSAN